MASRDLFRIQESCSELKKETIRPFSLQYLALGAILGNNRFVEDNRNELQINKHLFEHYLKLTYTKSYFKIVYTILLKTNIVWNFLMK